MHFLDNDQLYELNEPVYGFWIKRLGPVIKYANKWYVYYLVKENINFLQTQKIEKPKDKLNFKINNIDYVGEERVYGYFVDNFKDGAALIANNNNWSLFYPTNMYEVTENVTICDNLPLNPEDMTKEDFSARYQIISPLGRGRYGQTFKIVDKKIDKVLALKIHEHKSSGNYLEIKNNCDIVAKTKDYTDCFAEIISWFRLDNYLNDEFEIYIKSAIISTMPLYDEKLKKDNIDNISFLFEIFVALTVLYQQNFNHGDLHLGNIMFKKVNWDRVYTINGEQYVIKNQIMPIIIDFGKSSTGKDWTDYLLPFEILCKNFSMSRRLIDVASIRDIVLTHPIFTPLKNNKPGNLVKFFNRMIIRNLQILEEEKEAEGLNTYVFFGDLDRIKKYESQIKPTLISTNIAAYLGWNHILQFFADKFNLFPDPKIFG